MNENIDVLILFLPSCLIVQLTFVDKKKKKTATLHAVIKFFCYFYSTIVRSTIIFPFDCDVSVKKCERHLV